jgi:hypothetical protein
LETSHIKQTIYVLQLKIIAKMIPAMMIITLISLLNP